MGYRHRLQLLKPNNIPVDCTAEVVPGGIDLLRLNGKLLFRFDFQKIQGFSCNSEENLELEVHMGNGKMGKVKLQSPGPHTVLPSPVQALCRELDQALKEESRGYSKPGKTASNSSDGEEDLSSVPRAILDALEPGSPVAPTTVRYSRWESKDDEQDEGTRRMSRRSTNDSAESQGTSSTASSGTWGPGHKPVEGSISMADLMKRPSVADRRSVYMPAQRDGSSETTDQDHAGEDPRAMSTWTSSRPSLVPARSTARRRTTWDEQPEIVRTRSILNEELRKNSALLDRIGNVRLTSGEPAKYTNPLFDNLQETGTSPGKERATEVKVVIHGHEDQQPQSWTRKTAMAPFSDLDAMDASQLKIEARAAQELAERRLLALNVAAAERDRLEEELKKAGGSAGAGMPTTLSQLVRWPKDSISDQEDLKGIRGELGEAKELVRQYESSLAVAQEQASQLQHAKREYASQVDDYRETVYKLNQQLSEEQQGREQAQHRADQLQARLADLQKQLEKVRLQVKEAEDCAREADAACVTANEARAALRGDLESANKQIDRLREMNRHATARAEAAESRCSTDSAQVELLRAELQEVDQAAARAVQRAKEEAAHSQALQAELARLREQLKMSGNGASGDKDTVALLRAELAESSKQAKRYQNAFEKREQDVEELKALFNSLREEQAEMEVARSAAMAQAQSAHDEAVSAFRRADAATAEVRTLRERLQRRKSADKDNESTESLREQLATAKQEALQSQAALRTAEEALEGARISAEQSGIQARRSNEQISTMTEKAESLAYQLSEAREGSSLALKAAREESEALRCRLKASQAEAQSAIKAAEQAEARCKSANQAEQQIEQLLARMEGLGEMLDQERHRGRRAAEEAKRFKAALGEAQASLERAHQASKKNAKDYEAAVAEREAAQTELAGLRKRVASMHIEVAEVNHMRSLLKEARSTIRAAEAGQASAEEKAREMEDRVVKMARQAEMRQAEAEDARREAATMKVKSSEAEQRAADLEAEMQRLGMQLQAASTGHVARSASSVSMSVPSSPRKEQQRSPGSEWNAFGLPGADYNQSSVPLKKAKSPPPARKTRRPPATAVSVDCSDECIRTSLREEQIRRLEALELKFNAIAGSPRAASSKGASGRRKSRTSDGTTKATAHEWQR